MAKDRFDKLERNPVGKSLDPSTAGSKSRRFRRWLEFKGEKHVPLELESAAAPTSPNPPPPNAPSPPNRRYNDEQSARRRAERIMREEELQAARERARRARNRLYWILAGLGGISYLIYVLTQGGVGSTTGEFIIMIIAAIAVAVIRGGRGRNRWDD